MVTYINNKKYLRSDLRNNHEKKKIGELFF